MFLQCEAGIELNSKVCGMLLFRELLFRHPDVKILFGNFRAVGKNRVGCFVCVDCDFPCLTVFLESFQVSIDVSYALTSIPMCVPDN